MAMLNMSKKRPSSVPEGSQRAAVSVSEMASLCQLSRSRFHTLVREGVFPPPVQPGQSKRPYYPHDLIQQCLDIRRTGIGQNGRVVLFNRRSGKRPDRKQPAAAPSITKYPELIAMLREVKVSLTDEELAVAISTVFPGGIEGVNRGEIVRKLLRHLQGRGG